MSTPRLSKCLQAILDALPLTPGMRVLEVGYGPGALARAMADRVGAGQVLAIDRSARAIAQGQSKGQNPDPFEFSNILTGGPNMEPRKTPKPKLTAEAAYENSHLVARDLLDHIADLLQDMPAPGNDDHPIYWGHVGDLVQ